MDIPEFLQSVITTPEGWFSLGYLNANSNGHGPTFSEEWFKWPTEVDRIVAATLARESSVYFSAHLFSDKKSLRSLVLPSRTIQADLDNADIARALQPTILVETSPGRHQGYWKLREMPDVSQLEHFSKLLTYSIPDCDRGCWQLGHKMRMPGTVNYKYEGRPVVRVINTSLTTYTSLPLSLRNDDEPVLKVEEWQPQDLVPLPTPKELLQRYRRSIPTKVYQEYDKRSTNRSDALWGLMMALLRAGATRDEVFYLALHSANNKFADMRYNGERDLARDVLRAERASQTSSVTSLKEKIKEIRRGSGNSNEKRQLIAGIVREDLLTRGTFISTVSGEWFVREDTGLPILIGRHSENMDALLDEVYGLNAIEQEQHYVVASLHATSKTRGREGRIAYLSFYNELNNTVLLHTGRKHLLSVSERGIGSINNGELGVLFPWGISSEPFEPDLKKPMPLARLFEGCFDNVTDFTKEQVNALFTAWFYFLFFRDSVISRPILALFGQPGAGKSTMFRRIYALLYGGLKALDSITSPDNFDYAVASDPLVVFDNVDTWAPWLPDKLALSASTSDLVKRKLYTDNDTVLLKRQALVGITAHSPKFRREDVVDRLLIVNFERLNSFRTDTQILAGVLANRDKLWGGIVHDLRKILAVPLPSEDDVPKFRISDFARIGLRTAIALGFEDDFRAAINVTLHAQTAYNLAEENVLVETIKIWLKRKPEAAGVMYSVGDLWSSWSLHARDSGEFLKQFPRSLSLGRKLWSLQASLRSEFEVEYEVDSTGSRLWSFR